MGGGRNSIDNCSLGLLITLVAAVATDFNWNTRVTTKFGDIKGLWSRSSRGRLVAHYLGIPYARPPLGDLRFRSPQPWDRKWNGTFEATKNSPSCCQMSKDGSMIGQEDCLYLNIYVPKEISEKEKSGLPVMVHAYGGKFSTGNASSYKLPPDYIMDQDVILVVMNYRLNILGFFSTASRASPGNYGLKDIVQALRWIQENIRSFDGNPNKVTLWGHSAGAAAIHILALNKKTEGLFNRYILQSGFAVSPWVMNPRSLMRRVALEIANHLYCLPFKRNGKEKEKDKGCEEMGNEAGREKKGPTYIPDVAISGSGMENETEKYSEEEEEEMMKCLRNVEVEHLGNILNIYYNVLKVPCCLFLPTIEEESNDAVVTMHPLTAIKKRLFRDIPFIMGVVQEEGLVNTIGYVTDTAKQDELINNFETHVALLTKYNRIISNFTPLAEPIEKFYFEGNVSSMEEIQNITNVSSDGFIFYSAYQTLKYQSKVMNSSTYFYLFNYEGTFTHLFTLGYQTRYGVSHSDDLNYLLPILNVKLKDLMLHNTENDITMINIMTELWTNFANTGVPSAWRISSWPDYKDSERFLLIGDGKMPNVTVGDTFFQERMEFWDELYVNITPYLNFVQKESKDVSNTSTNRCLGILLYLTSTLFAIYFP
ncbi:juvenile hormone esterase-like [Apis laboriosa]|uniref:juvenile hormone esterase-like n=1 Tax=Apis laboriosa TaxID=183418 RepID=UPI001CC648E1|nr:juvenile hormone esterase-like [Apis laboriosa]